MGNCKSTVSATRVHEFSPPTGLPLAEGVVQQLEEYDWKIMSAHQAGEAWVIDEQHGGAFYWYKKKRVFLSDSLHVKINGRVHRVTFEPSLPSKTRRVKSISPFSEGDGPWISYVSLVQRDDGSVVYVSNGNTLHCVEHYDTSTRAKTASN